MSERFYMNDELLYEFDQDSRVLGVSVHPGEIEELIRTHRTNDKSLSEMDLRLPNPHDLDDPYNFRGVRTVTSIPPSSDGYLISAKRPDQERDNPKGRGLVGLLRKLLPPTIGGNER